jgi:RNA polymerase sigma factor (sigma-70 family)
VTAELDDFVRRSRPRLLRAARLATGSWSDGEDLLQEAYQRTFAKWAELDGDPAREAYVLRTLSRLHVRRARRFWRREVALDLPDSASVSADHERALDIRLALRALPSGQRLVVIHRYYLDLSVEATARALGCTTGTVKSQTARALGRLHLLLAETNWEDCDDTVE